MKCYRVLDVKQGSDEWRKLRLSKVTASKVPALLGLCPYQSADDVLSEMLTGKEREFTDSQRFIFQKGHLIEARLRSIVEGVRRMQLPATVMVSTREPMLMASLDGYCEKHNLSFEAKLVGKAKLQEIRAGRIPLHHMAQVQAQLLVSGAERCIYAAMGFSGEYVVKEILPDPDYHSRILEAVAAFLERLPAEMRESVAEPALTEEERLHDEWIALEAELIHLQVMGEMEIGVRHASQTPQIPQGSGLRHGFGFRSSRSFQWFRKLLRVG
jgi:putative phage-type endonuclease